MNASRKLSSLLLVFLWVPVHALVQAGPESSAEQITRLPKGIVAIVAVVGAVIAMLGGMWFVFARVKAKEEGFGPNSLKALGLVLFLPTLLIRYRSPKFPDRDPSRSSWNGRGLRSLPLQAG